MLHRKSEAAVWTKQASVFSDRKTNGLCGSETVISEMTVS